MKNLIGIILGAIIALTVPACFVGGYDSTTAYRDIMAHDPSFQKITLGAIAKEGFSSPQSSCIYREAIGVVIGELGENYVKSSIEQWRNSTEFTAGVSQELSFNGDPFDPLFYLQGPGRKSIVDACDLGY